jgi:hypothetical protein
MVMGTTRSPKSLFGERGSANQLYLCVCPCWLIGCEAGEAVSVSGEVTMLLFWRIRYLDSRDRQFKDRDLWLDTDTLDPVTKAAVEATYEMTDSSRRSMLRHRALFREERPDKNSMGFGGCFCVPDYFEDEAGQELSPKRMAVILSGNPEAVLFPPGTRPHDVEYCMAEKPAVHLDQIVLSREQVDVLGYFARDLRELLDSALYRDGPGSISGPGSGGRWVLQTAISDEEIRSFVTIFRRLYMEKEPASFDKAVSVFGVVLAGHPIAKWVQAIATEYTNSLQQPPDSVPMLGPQALPFTRKRLIDVYLYTHYAHQPDERRARQFNECLAAVGGNRPSLTWLFLTEIWKCAIEFRNGGGLIADFYDRYCQSRSSVPGVLTSLRADHPGFGALEKKADKEARILREKAEELAKAHWEQAGRPAGGHTPWIQLALDQLRSATGRG